ncbi:conserved Plasmodium protein, unknown function [Plasmodium chabaudi adami]|uniref:ELM2 domain-containing protein n=1 Tax=Plasmodium chabaudi adami TaxID=5826 RepID=A0A1D3S1P7_PLACE|nr:conserved Plasmodium protein, unknown function [Plasmodium chabaudi adami]
MTVQQKHKGMLISEEEPVNSHIFSNFFNKLNSAIFDSGNKNNNNSNNNNTNNANDNSNNDGNNNNSMPNDYKENRNAENGMEDYENIEYIKRLKEQKKIRDDAYKKMANDLELRKLIERAQMKHSNLNPSSLGANNRTNQYHRNEMFNHNKQSEGIDNDMDDNNGLHLIKGEQNALDNQDIYNNTSYINNTNIKGGRSLRNINKNNTNHNMSEIGNPIADHHRQLISSQENRGTKKKNSEKISIDKEILSRFTNSNRNNNHIEANNMGRYNTRNNNEQNDIYYGNQDEEENDLQNEYNINQNGIQDESTIRNRLKNNTRNNIKIQARNYIRNQSKNNEYTTNSKGKYEREENYDEYDDEYNNVHDDNNNVTNKNNDIYNTRRYNNSRRYNNYNEEYINYVKNERSEKNENRRRQVNYDAYNNDDGMHNYDAQFINANIIRNKNGEIIGNGIHKMPSVSVKNKNDHDHVENSKSNAKQKENKTKKTKKTITKNNANSANAPKNKNNATKNGNVINSKNSNILQNERKTYIPDHNEYSSNPKHRATAASNAHHNTNRGGNYSNNDNYYSNNYGANTRSTNINRFNERYPDHDDDADQKKRKKRVTEEGSKESNKINIGDSYQVSKLPNFFLCRSEFMYKSYEPVEETNAEPCLTCSGLSCHCKAGGAILVYSPLILERIREKCMKNRGYHKCIKNEIELSSYIQECAKNWKSNVDEWVPFSPEYAYKLLHYANYDPHKAISIMKSSEFSFRKIMDPPTRKYQNKWKPKDKRENISKNPFPSPLTIRTYLSKRHHNSGYHLR